MKSTILPSPGSQNSHVFATVLQGAPELRVHAGFSILTLDFCYKLSVTDRADSSVVVVACLQPSDRQNKRQKP